MLASGIVLPGLAKYIGMDCHAVVDTDDPAKDLADRISMATDRLTEYDFIHVHTKAPDTADHTKDPTAKQVVIQSLDAGLARVMGRLRKREDLLLVVASDHATPSSTPLLHYGDPVPLTTTGRGV